MKSIIRTGRLIIWLIIIAFRIALAATFALQSIEIVYHSQSNWIFDVAINSFLTNIRGGKSKPNGKLFLFHTPWLTNFLDLLNFLELINKNFV